MTTVTCIVIEILVDMTCLTLGLMMAIKAKIVIMIECRGFPTVNRMALIATVIDLSMQCVPWIGVTTFASIAYSVLNQLMGKLSDGPKGYHAVVITVTGHAILFDQLLMEGYLFFFRTDRQSFSCLDAYLLNLMTGDALIRRTADEGRMTRKAVSGDLLMSLYRFAWADHQMGP